MDLDPDLDLYCDTGKTCLGRGMHCSRTSSASSLANSLVLVSSVAD